MSILDIFRTDVKKRLVRHINELNEIGALPEAWFWNKNQITAIEHIDEEIIKDINSLHQQHKDNPNVFLKVYPLLEQLHKDLDMMLQQNSPSADLMKKEAEIVNRLIRNIKEVLSKNIPVTRVLVTDVIGTITKKDEISRTCDYILSSIEIQKQICLQLKLKNEYLIKMIKIGKEMAIKGNKSGDAFEEFLDVWCPAVAICYNNFIKTGVGVKREMESDVEEVFRILEKKGINIIIYSRGNAGMTLAGTITAGLGDLRIRYYSSEDLGNKFSSGSYQKIANDLQVKIEEMAYISADKNKVTASLQAGVGKAFVIDRNSNNVVFVDGYYILSNYRQLIEYLSL